MHPRTRGFAIAIALLGVSVGLFVLIRGRATGTASPKDWDLDTTTQLPINQEFGPSGGGYGASHASWMYEITVQLARTDNEWAARCQCNLTHTTGKAIIPLGLVEPFLRALASHPFDRDGRVFSGGPGHIDISLETRKSVHPLRVDNQSFQWFAQGEPLAPDRWYEVSAMNHHRAINAAYRALVQAIGAQCCGSVGFDY